VVTAAHVDQAIRALDLAPAEPAPLPVWSAPGLPKLNLPEPMGLAQPMRLRTLERYLPSDRKATFLMRWAGKLKLANPERANS
jgi:hypothetical protein